MLRTAAVTALGLIAIGCSPSPQGVVTGEQRQADGRPPPNQLVHVQGTFVSVQPTGKRHQSFVFTFRTRYQLRGPRQAPTLMDKLVRFELYQDFGGRDLVAELCGRAPQGGVALAGAARSVADSKAYELVLWLFPPRRVYGGGHVNAQLVGSAVRVRE